MIPERYREQLREEGFCVAPGVLSRPELAQLRSALDRGVNRSRLGRHGHADAIDPNPQNLRVHNLPALAQAFVDLARHPRALPFVREVIGPHFLVSNFSANVALPGSGSMRLHSDQALLAPPPWTQPWAVSIAWCLDDVHDANGATRYLPGSHRLTDLDAIAPDAIRRTLPFEAQAGSLVVIDGRLWHTSGANVTRNERRSMLFADYAVDFLRGEVNWEAALPPDVKASMDVDTRRLFGLGVEANVRLGGALTRLDGPRLSPTRAGRQGRAGVGSAREQRLRAARHARSQGEDAAV
jgi:ectoine hydroxylase-related dioxygenase (phytanoyl-CoA dioxygenase family)